MQTTRILYALAAAALLVPFGSVAAEETTTATTTPDKTFNIAISPHEQWILPGATATYRVAAEGRAETVLRLAVRAPDGVVATLGSDELALAPGQPAHSVLTVEARGNATKPIAIVVVATSTSGEAHEARAFLYVREKPSEPRPCAAYDNGAAANGCDRTKPAKPAPHDARHPDLDSYEKRAAALEHRLASMLARIEKALAQMERHDRERPYDKPVARDPKPALPPMDVTLRLSDENVTLGEEGRRVALLIENNGREGRLPLALRFETEGGWKVELEKDGVYLHPHERTYLWIRFDPGTTGAVAYAIRAGDASVQGVANFPAASIA